MASHRSASDRVEPAPVPVVVLADLVVQRLLGIGLDLQSATNRAGAVPTTDPFEKATRARLARAVEELDVLIRDVRTLALRAITGDGAMARDGASMSRSDARVAAMHHVERAASLLAANQPAAEDGAAWWVVETACRDLHGVVIALGDSSLDRSAPSR